MKSPIKTCDQAITQKDMYTTNDGSWDEATYVMVKSPIRKEIVREDAEVQERKIGFLILKPWLWYHIKI